MTLWSSHPGQFLTVYANERFKPVWKTIVIWCCDLANMTSPFTDLPRAIASATGMHAEFGKIAHLTRTAGGEASPLSREIAHLSNLNAFLVVINYTP